MRKEFAEDGVDAEFDGGRRERVHALERGLRVLDAFDGGQPAMTLSDVARATGLAPATARRCLLTLEAMGYVHQRDRAFVLSARVLTLGAGYFAAMSLPQLAQHVLDEVAMGIGRPTSVTVLDGNEVVYIAHHRAAGPSLARHYVGARLPAHATSTGHVLIAHLSRPEREQFLRQAPFARYTSRTPTTRAELETCIAEVTTLGYALVEDTVEYGAAAVAVPVVDRHGTVVAAVNVSIASISDRDRATMLDALESLRDVADRVSVALARFPDEARSA